MVDEIATLKESKDRLVAVSSEAVTTMLLHAAKHNTTVVHGVLLGRYKNADAVEITAVVPVCHEAPTKTLVDTALSLIAATENTDIVGWYTAPERLADTKPSSTALRIVASLATDKEPVLLVLQNEAIVKGLRGEGTESPVVKAYGKDFGKQWLEPLTNLELKEGSVAAARKAFQTKSTVVNDFVDHLETESASTEWSL